MSIILSSGVSGLALEIAPSAVRNATLTSGDIQIVGASALHLFLNVTAVTGGQNILLRISIRDPSSGLYAIVAETPAIVATGLVMLILSPGIAPVANVAVQTPVPNVLRGQVVHSGAGNFTYSVGASIAT